jgi:hypothetical protein
MKHDISINDDYAGIWISDNTYLYYGYEHTVDFQDYSEWCFVVVKNGKLIHKVKASTLSPDSKADHHEVDRMLLRGISWWIQTNNLL